MRRIALFLPNWIGDVVMATPAIRAVRDHFPEARTYAVCKPYVAETLAGSRWFDEVLLCDRRWRGERGFLSVAARLRQERVDTAVLFPNSFRSALLAWHGGCSTVVGFARYGRNILLSRRLYPLRDHTGHPKPAPIIDDYNRIVQLLGVPNPGHKMELHTTSEDERAANTIWDKYNLGRHRVLIGFNPGGAFGAAKHWPVSHFVELAHRLVQSHNCGILVLCGPTERDIARDIVTQTHHPHMVGLSEDTLSLGLTKALTRRLQVLVTTDSGPRHFAAAFDRPVVVVVRISPGRKRIIRARSIYKKKSPVVRVSNAFVHWDTIGA
ncbi:MAG: glycosyltransferase family 9 protein [Bacteroidales bacterium]|nr:glycosyltransferase family 9 protein [Bacteroidales bacterium]